MSSIRSAQDSDETALFALVSAFPTPTPPGFETFSSAFRDKLCDPQSCVAVAENGDGLVGYVSGYRHTTFYASGQTAWVDELLVSEAFRGNGLGRKLMEFVEAWALDHRCVLIGLATSGARDFYTHLGFESKAGYFKRYLSGASLDKQA